MKFQGKSVLITGASSGIGKALAAAFAQQGAALTLGARRLPALEEVRAELTQRYRVPVAVQVCDVTNANACQALVEAATHAHGRLDVAIANAGISMRAGFENVELNVLRQVMETNFWGAVYIAKAAVPALVATRGSLVGISSVAGIKGLPKRTGYSASKFALNGFLEALRIELKPQGVHVLTACPGYTASAIRERALVADGNPQGATPRQEAKMMTAETAARYIVAATAKRKRSLVLTRTGKATSLLQKLAPGYLDGLVARAIAKEDAALPQDD